MKLSKELTTVTPFSKIMALLLFVILLAVSFVMGMNYKNIVDNLNNIKTGACTMDAKICPDGQVVGRISPRCEFAPCPTSIPQKGIFCGGIRGSSCPDGYDCVLSGKYPDASGTCVKRTLSPKNFSCPGQDFVDCMPGQNNPKRTECSTEFLTWAKENCPGFQGAAY